MQHDIYDISNRPMVEGARAINLDAVKTSVYDLIVFSNVLEHVPYPRDSLREIANAMRPETILYVEVPHEEVMRLSDDPAQRQERKRHWHEHINFFTPSALDAVFARCWTKHHRAQVASRYGCRQGQPCLFNRGATINASRCSLTVVSAALTPFH